MIVQCLLRLWTQKCAQKRSFFILSPIHTLTSLLSLFQHQTNKAKQFHPVSDIPWKQQPIQIRSVWNSIIVSQKTNNHPSVAFPSYRHLNLSTSPLSLSLFLSISLILIHEIAWRSLSACEHTPGKHIVQTVVNRVILLYCFCSLLHFAVKTTQVLHVLAWKLWNLKPFFSPQAYY